MWENLTKDPLIRVVLVIFVGILAFSLFFNLLTGSNGMAGYGGSMGGGEHMGNMGGAGYSYGNMISGLLMLLVNILVIVLVIAVIAGLVVWARNTFSKVNIPPYVRTMGNDPFIRTVLTITAAIIGLLLIMSVFNGSVPFGYAGMRGAFGVYGILTLLIRVLTFVLTISLVAAAFLYIREQYEKTGTGYGAGGADVNDTAAKEPYNSDTNRIGDK